MVTCNDSKEEKGLQLSMVMRLYNLLRLIASWCVFWEEFALLELVDCDVEAGAG